MTEEFENSSGPTKNSAFRLAPVTLSELDVVAEELADSSGAAKPSRTNAIRYLAKNAHQLRGWPLLGDLGAGRPQNCASSERMTLGSMFPADAVVYRVVGNSMAEDAILDGDYVIVRPDVDVPNGSIVVAWIHDVGSVIKRYDAKGKRLVTAEKSRWSHILTDADQVLGVLVGVVRRQR